MKYTNYFLNKKEYDDSICNQIQNSLNYYKETKEFNFFDESETESYLIATYDVKSTTYSTQLLSSRFNLNQITKMYIDDEQVTPSSYYTFNSIDKHNVKIVYNKCNFTSCYCMFEYCYNLSSLDLSHFDTSNVTNMSSMFNRCSGLTSLDLSNFDTSNVWNMGLMFESCSGLTSLDLSSFDTSNVTNMSHIFWGCKYLTSFTFGDKADVSKVITYTNMFSGITSSGTIIYPCGYSNAWDKLLVSNSGSTKFSSSWTATCQSSEINVKLKLIENGLEITEGNVVVNNTTFTFNETEQVWEGTYLAEQQSYPIFLNDVEVGTTNHRKLQYIFIGSNNSSYNGFNITETVSASNTSSSYSLIYSSFTPYIDAMLINGKQVSISQYKTFNSVGEYTVQMIMDTSNVTNMSEMFYNCYGLTSLDLSSFDTSNVTNMRYMFNNCSGLISLDLSSFDTSNVTNMISMFYNCSSLTSLNVSNWNTSNVTSMQNMFSGCTNLTSLDLSSFDTSKVTNMGCMFDECRSLTSLDLSNFYTSKVTDMGYMFTSCSGLTSLDLSSFNTSNVTNMNHMFFNCYNLTSLDLNSFDTSNVTTMTNMFYECYNLTSLNLSSFDTSKVTNMTWMFYDCRCLTSLNLSSFDTSKVTTMYYMFNRCSSLTSIEFGNKANVSKVTSYDSMFTNVPSTCVLTLCYNTQTSWDTLLTNATFNGTVNYQTCTEPTSE